MSLHPIGMLARGMIDVEDGAVHLRDEYLRDLPPTDRLAEELATAGRKGPPDSPWVARLKDRIGMAGERDRRVAVRRALGPEYAECWCLGTGGADTYMLSVETPTGPTPTVREDDRTTGPFEAYRRACPCPDGQQAGADRRLAQEELERAYDRYVAARRREVARLPRRSRGVTPDSWTEDVMRAAGPAGFQVDMLRAVTEPLTRWVANHLEGHDGPPVLLLVGGFGNGKTTLAAWAGNEFLEGGHDVIMRKVAELLAELRAAPWRAKEAGEQAPPPTELGILKACMGARLLILDDLGAEDLAGPTADRDVAALLLMIDRRIDAGLPTVVTTNLGGRDLRERIGDRLFDRLVGDRISALVKFRVPSLRRSEW